MSCLFTAHGTECDCSLACTYKGNECFYALLNDCAVSSGASRIYSKLLCLHWLFCSIFQGAGMNGYFWPHCMPGALKYCLRMIDPLVAPRTQTFFNTFREQVNKRVPLSIWWHIVPLWWNIVVPLSHAAFFFAVIGQIRTVIGQAQLLIAQRFKQFSGLIDLSEVCEAHIQQPMLITFSVVVTDYQNSTQ